MTISRIPSDGIADGAVTTGKIGLTSVSKDRLAAGVFATPAEVKAYTLSDVAIAPSRLVHAPMVAKAWVIFDGSAGTPDSTKTHFAVSSITDNGVGDYTINWTNAFSSASYGYQISAEKPASNLASVHVKPGGQTASSLRVQTMDASFSPVDCPKISVLALGDLP